MRDRTELLARELCVRRHSREDVTIGDVHLTGGTIVRACHGCMADAIDLLPRLVDAPPSAPTGDGMPTVTDEDVEDIKALIFMRHISGDAGARLLALLDWATRRQEQGNG